MCSHETLGGSGFERSAARLFGPSQRGASHADARATRPEGEKRYRRERITVRIAPQIVSGGRLQIDVDLEGEVATLDADGPIARHPLQRGATFVMISGERHNLEVSVRSSDEAEGWSVVQYVVQVTSRF